MGRMFKTRTIQIYKENRSRTNSFRAISAQTIFLGRYSFIYNANIFLYYPLVAGHIITTLLPS